MTLEKLFVFLAVVLVFLLIFGETSLPYLKYLAIGFAIGLGFYLARNH